MRVNYLERVYKGWGNGKLKAVVCEDEEALQLFLEKQVCECMKEAGINGSCEVFSSAEELLEKGNPFYDLYLLDIQLGQMTGMELAEKIREKDDHAVILFATNYKEMITPHAKYYL